MDIIRHLFLLSFLKIKFIDNQMTRCFSFDHQINVSSLLVSLQVTTVTSFTPHGRDSQQQAVAVTKPRTSLKEHAAGSRGTMKQLISDHTTDKPVNIRTDLGKPETIKRSLPTGMYLTHPNNAASLSKPTLDGEWTTVDGDPFLVYDNGADCCDRMPVFPTDLGFEDWSVLTLCSWMELLMLPHYYPHSYM